MNELEIYQKVNACETLEELALVIESLANAEGVIVTRTDKLNANKMAARCRNFHNEIPRNLTRCYGIRQQAIYIAHYENMEKDTKQIAREVIVNQMKKVFGVEE